MDRQQAEQEVTLVEVRMETDSLKVSQKAKGSHAFTCKCVFAFVAGLAVALVVGIILHCFVFTPLHNQVAPALSEKVILACKLKETNERKRYHIFTASKAATYLIYGWVKLPNATNEDFVLEQIRESSIRNIQKNKTDTTEIFLFSKVMLADNTTVSLSFTSHYTDNLFHVYEL